MKSSDVSICMPRPCKAAPQNYQLAAVVLSIGAASHFMLFLDSVVDNLLPAAMPFLLTIYKTKEDADRAWELVVSSRIYGLAFGCFLSILLSNAHGRKIPVVLGTIMDIIGVLLATLTVYAPGGVFLAVVGRFVNGVGQGIVQTSGSVMLAEIPPMRRRGTALATLTMWACLGELGGMLISLEELLGTPKYWHIAMAVPLIPLIPALIVLCKAPESPRYLFMVNHESEARKALSFYQNSIDAKQTIEEITDEMKLEDLDINSNMPKLAKLPKETSASQIFTRLKDGYFSRPLLIALFVQSFLWVSYSTQIFENVGLSANKAQRASLLMSLPQAILSMALLGCFDNFSRRSLLIVPTVASVFIGTLAILFTSFEKVLLRGIPLAVVLPVLASCDLSAAAISGESAFAIVPELFLHSDKILGTAIVGISQNVFGGILTNFLLTAVNQLGTENVLAPFVVVNILYVIINYCYLPETAEKTPQEIAVHFSADPPFQNLLRRVREFPRLLLVPVKLFTLSNLLNLFVFVLQVILCVSLLNFVWSVGGHVLGFAVKLG